MMKTNILIIMLTIISINARGLNKKSKRHQIYGMREGDIICLQETHWDEERMREVENEWRGDVYANNGDGNARGVAILTKRGVIENVRRCADDGDGRLIGITFECMGKEFQLLNVYAPNDERERREYFERLEGVCGENCMIVGDFNVWCGRLDVSANMCFKNDSSRKMLEKMKRVKGLRDEWRERNPEGRVFSRKQVVRGELKQSRIDLILSSKELSDIIKAIEYKVTTISDHMILQLTLGQEIKRRGGGVWCMNGEVLKEEKYKTKMRECITRRKNDSMYEDDIAGWWESLKKEIKELSKTYSRDRNRTQRERDIRLKRELGREADRAEKERGYNIEEYIRIKEELKEIEQGRCQGAIIRSRAKYAIEGEKCTAYFLGLEKTRQKNNYLEQVEGKDGEKITDFLGIAERVEEFYRDLFRKEEVDEESSRQLLDKVKARLSKDDREMCERQIGTEEIDKAISLNSERN